MRRALELSARRLAVLLSHGTALVVLPSALVIDPTIWPAPLMAFAIVFAPRASVKRGASAGTC